MQAEAEVPRTRQAQGRVNVPCRPAVVEYEINCFKRESGDLRGILRVATAVIEVAHMPAIVIAVKIVHADDAGLAEARRLSPAALIRRIERERAKQHQQQRSY